MTMSRPGLRTRFSQTVLLRWGLLRRGMTLGVRALVMDSQDRLLLVRHTYVPGWYLPGGGVDPGESAGECIVRELREEAGIVPTEAPRLFGLYRNTAGPGRDHVALYMLREFTQIDNAHPDPEIAEAGFFARTALPEATTRATVARLAEIFDGVPPSDIW